MCQEQIGQMQATYDAFLLIKIAHDAGIDVVSDSIDFYCYDFGSQADTFWVCMKRIFGEVVLTSEKLSDWGTSKCTYRVPLPELCDFYPLLKDAERSRYINKFNAMLRSEDDFFGEFEMEGMMAGNCFHITLSGDYGLYSPLLAQMVAIRNEVHELVRTRRAQLVNGLRGIVMAKMVYDRSGIVVDVSLEDQLDVVFSSIMQQCDNPRISLATDHSLSFETMITTLTSTLDQAVINTNREDVPA